MRDDKHGLGRWTRVCSDLERGCHPWLRVTACQEFRAARQTIVITFKRGRTRCWVCGHLCCGCLRGAVSGEDC